MIVEVRTKNCYAFEDDITFSMKADMRNKKFGANVHKENNFNVLKTVGIYGPNNAGTYVCASEFKASFFKIFTSMRVGDDIEKGISTFYGELLRIKKAMDYLNQGNMLVLIDEIFKGTNYQDRIYGAKKE